MSRTSPLERGLEYCPRCDAYVPYEDIPEADGDSDFIMVRRCAEGHIITEGD